MSENSASDGTFDQSASVPPKPSREGGNNGQGEANDSQNYLFAHDQDRSPEESPRSGGDVHPAPSHSLRSGDSARRRTIDDSAAVDKDARPDQAGNSPTISDQRPPPPVNGSTEATGDLNIIHPVNRWTKRLLVHNVMVAIIISLPIPFAWAFFDYQMSYKFTDWQRYLIGVLGFTLWVVIVFVVEAAVFPIQTEPRGNHDSGRANWSTHRWETVKAAITDLFMWAVTLFSISRNSLKDLVLRSFNSLKRLASFVFSRLCHFGPLGRDRFCTTIMESVVYRLRRRWNAFERPWLRNALALFLFWAFSVIVRLFYYDAWNIGDFAIRLSPYLYSFLSYFARDLFSVHFGPTGALIAPFEDTIFGIWSGLCSAVSGIWSTISSMQSLSSLTCTIGRGCEILWRGLIDPPPYDFDFRGQLLRHEPIVETDPKISTTQATNIHQAVVGHFSPLQASEPSPWRPDPMSVIGTLLLVHIAYLALAQVARQNPLRWAQIRSRSLSGPHWSPLGSPSSPRRVKGSSLSTRSGDVVQSVEIVPHSKQNKGLGRGLGPAASSGRVPSQGIRATRSRSRRLVEREEGLGPSSSWS